MTKRELIVKCIEKDFSSIEFTCYDVIDKLPTVNRRTIQAFLSEMVSGGKLFNIGKRHIKGSTYITLYSKIKAGEPKKAKVPEWAKYWPDVYAGLKG